MASDDDVRSPLAGAGVLVTRPAHQALPLARLIEQAGGRAILFPTIEIAPPQDPGPLLAVLDHLDAYDLAIFISPNAVEQAFGWLRARKHAWPTRVPVVCVGAASVRALERFEVSALAPPERFDSEALLALPVLQNMAGKAVVIFRGDGGRELLGETLTERGARIEYAECYRRVRPQAEVVPVAEDWRRGAIDIVTITSTAGLRNLYDMLGELVRPWLIYTPVVVLSEAQAVVCRQLGFVGDILIATAASDEAILEAIKTWWLRRRLPTPPAAP